MAFDFNNTSFNRKEEPFHNTSTFTSEFDGGFSNPSFGSDTGATDSFDAHFSSSFQNAPEHRQSADQIYSPNFTEPPTIYRGKRPRFASAPIQIPWRIIIPVILAIAVLAFLYVNRYAISSFISQLVSWVVTILILVLIIRLLFFGGRRHW